MIDGPDYTKMNRGELIDYVCTLNRIIRSLSRELDVANRRKQAKQQKVFRRIRPEISVPA